MRYTDLEGSNRRAAIMFIILQPHSNTNPSDKYRVVDHVAWQRYVNRAQTGGYAVAGEYASYQAAEAYALELNQELTK